MKTVAHEDLTRELRAEGSSDRVFAVVFVAVFLLIAIWPILAGQVPRWWAAAIAAGLALIAVVRPTLLAPLNRMWMRIGLLLGRLVSPIALGIVYFLVLTPVGLLLRFQGKDLLRLEPRRDTSSYWIERQPPGPPPDSMTRQF